MAGGGYGVTVRGLDELKVALKGTAGGVRDLRRAFRPMAETMERSVNRHLDMNVHYGGSGKDGAGHKALPKLSSTIQSGVTINGPWVKMERADLYVHEFGGTSFWYRSGGVPGLLRGANRRHANVTEAATRAGISGHAVYQKPRISNGRFLWNVGFRERSALGEQLQFGLAAVCNKHGLPYEMPGNPALGLSPQTWSRSA